MLPHEGEILKKDKRQFMYTYTQTTMIPMITMTSTPTTTPTIIFQSSVVSGPIVVIMLVWVVDVDAGEDLLVTLLA